MNDREFTERLLANPLDISVDFLAALQEHPAREAQRQEARNFDALLRRELTSVSASAELRARLLNPEQMDISKTSKTPLIANPSAAANDSFFRRMLPVAACLLVAIGLAMYSHTSGNAALEEEIFAHVYREAFLLDNAARQVMPDIDAKLEVLGVQLSAGLEADNMNVTFAEDCWIAQQIAVHLVMRGASGPVSVMMIPSTPVASEFNIGDERFNGLVTPTAGGNLVVIGEKQEAIAEYRNLISRNLTWEY